MSCARPQPEDNSFQQCFTSLMKCNRSKIAGASSWTHLVARIPCVWVVGFPMSGALCMPTEDLIYVSFCEGVVWLFFSNELNCYFQGRNSIKFQELSESDGSCGSKATATLRNQHTSLANFSCSESSRALEKLSISIHSARVKIALNCNLRRGAERREKNLPAELIPRKWKKLKLQIHKLLKR
jgi:hypothetical protein